MSTLLDSPAHPATAARRAPTAAAPSAPARLRLEIRGAVQGVGFRPFVYRLARQLGLAGWVRNDARGVDLEVQGAAAALRAFVARLPAEIPPRAEIHHYQPGWLPATTGETGFHIRPSGEAGSKQAVVLADAATCPACRREVFDAADRRHLYPFTNCTDCGPRFTIVRALPYDRPHTTMAGFAMCSACRSEYEDPLDRRFHAQPNACPVCGPRVTLWDRSGATTAEGPDALAAAAAALLAGEIVAVKGLGGFHLVVDAANAGAVAELRRRKVRRDKPLALMVPDLEQARRLCLVDDAAAALLASAEAPVVLLPKRPAGGTDSPAVADEVAPGCPELGLMLPYTPLHHLLLAAIGRPVVATSGNLSEEPIVIDEGEVVESLGGIADRFLVHDRPIARHADDSVVRFVSGAPSLLRRARGYAPLPVPLPRPDLATSGDGTPAPALLAVGAHLKNTVGLALGQRAFLSQHLGDMENPRTLAAFETAVADFLDLWEARPALVVHDLHPEYATTRWAETVTGAVANATSPEAASPDAVSPYAALAGLPRLAVQHHHAHLAACLAEHGGGGPALGFTWDGTGYGPDGTIWGGEVLLGNAAGYRRVARLRPFRLPGGDAAVREPRRSALALLHETFRDGATERYAALHPDAFTAQELSLLGRMLAGGFQSPWTSSAGRLFDGVAALAGLHPRVTFEGQAAMALEAVVDGAEESAYPVALDDAGDLLELDWRPLVAAVAEDAGRGVAPGRIAGRFHNALAEAVAELARRLVERHAAELPVRRAALTGGCFQNRRLTEAAAGRLAAAGFEVLLHRRVPPNDGGIAYGQLAVAAARLAAEKSATTAPGAV